MFIEAFEKTAKSMGGALIGGLKATDQTKSLFSKTVKPALNKGIPKVAASLAQLGTDVAKKRAVMTGMPGKIMGKATTSKQVGAAVNEAKGIAAVRGQAQAAQKPDPLAKPVAQRLQDRKAAGQPTAAQKPGFMSNFSAQKPAQVTQSKLHTKGAVPGSQQLPATTTQVQKGQQRAGTLPSAHSGVAGGPESPKSMPHSKDGSMMSKLTNAPWKRYGLAAAGGYAAAKVTSGPSQPQQPMLGY
jgi:hypothetical protein